MADPIRILLVEDSEADAVLVERELGRQGFAVHLERVETQAALVQALEGPWDLVISDYALPGFSGLRALEIVKTLAPDLAVVMLSGSVEEADLVEAMRAGAADYLLKGHLSRLARVIERELRDAEAKHVSREEARVRRQEEERFRFVVERTGEVLYRLDFATMTYDYISPGIEKLTGYAPAAINEIGFASLVVATTRPGGGPLPRQLLSEAREAGEAAEFWADYQVRTKSGELRWLADHSFPWTDDTGRLLGSVGVLSDITARRHGEQVLRESEERYRALYEKEHAGREQAERLRAATQALGSTLELREVLALILKELQLLVPYDSASVQQMKGQHMELVGGYGFKDLSAVLGVRFQVGQADSPDNPNRDVVLKRATVVVDDAPRRYPGFAWGAHANTPIRSWMGVPLLFGDRLIGMLTLDREQPGFYNAAHVPIVESFATQAAIALENARLYAAARQELEERKRVEEQLRQSQKMEAIGRLAGGIAHDFNNLLGVILGYTELASAKVEKGGPVHAKLEQVRKAAERAAALTGQLLAFSRKQVLVPEVLDLSGVISDLSGMLARVIGEDIVFVPRLPRGLGTVRADRGQVGQAILNLALNARDAMPRGGRLAIEAEDVELTGAYVAEHPDVAAGPYVRVSVTDTGTGMEPEVLRHMFEPFFTTKEPGKGTGLGLAMVYGFLQQSGGHVTVESQPGVGTTFRLFLPRLQELATPEPVPLATPPGGSETILLVEDETSLREMTREVLTMNGYRVIEAPSAKAALQLARDHAAPIELLLTDMVMPGLSGADLAEGVRSLRPDTDVLFMSGYSDEATIQRGMSAPGAAFLQKPFSPATLLARLREVLDRRR